MLVLKKLNPTTGQYEVVSEFGGGGSDLVTSKDLKLDFELSYASTTIPVVTITEKDYFTKNEYLYLITEYYADYAFQGCSTSLNGTTVSGLFTQETIKVDDKKYYKGIIDCSAVLTALNGANLDSLVVSAGWASGRWTGNEKVWLTSEYSEELFLRDFISIEITDTFVMAVDDALKTTDSISALNGKTVIFMGDSYTKGATSQFQALCEKHGATADNYGIVSSSICGDDTGSQGFQPMHKRTVNVCNSYITNGTTGNVGAVVFMGGANDGFGKTSWLGTGTNDKNTNHIYGALHKIFKTFRNTFDCPIFVILQPYFPNGRVPDANMTEETAQILGFESAEQALTFDDKEYCAYSMQKKQAIVKEMAEFYNCIITDCCFNWHSIFRPSDLAKYWSADGHPTATGYQAIADDLEQTMLTCKWK